MSINRGVAPFKRGAFGGGPGKLEPICRAKRITLSQQNWKSEPECRRDVAAKER